MIRSSKDFLKELKTHKDALSLGNLASRKTQDHRSIYYFGNLNPINDIPEIAQEAKGIVLLFTGAGSKGSTGKVYYKIVNRMAKKGWSAVTMDYPFHGDGPKNKKLYDSGYFLDYLEKHILNYAQLNKPIVLVGTSLGSIVIDRLLIKKPNLHKIIKGIILAAPGGPITQELGEHYQLICTNGQFLKNIEKYNVKLCKKSREWMWSILSEKPYSDKRSFLNPAIVLRGIDDDWSTSEMAKKLAEKYNMGVFKECPTDHIKTLTARGKNGKEGTLILDLIEDILPVGPGIPSHKNELKRICYLSPLANSFLKEIGLYQDQFLNLSDELQNKINQIWAEKQNQFLCQLASLLEISNVGDKISLSSVTQILKKTIEKLDPVLVWTSFSHTRLLQTGLQPC